jgi:hypothetical protein
MMMMMMMMLMMMIIIIIIIISAVGIATGYGLDRRGIGVRVLAGAKLSPPDIVHTVSGAHPTSYPIGNGGHFPRGKAAGV